MDYDELCIYCDEHEVTSADEARQIALDWENVTSDESLSYGEIAAWDGYFKELADKFPELKDEFKEEGII